MEEILILVAAQVIVVVAEIIVRTVVPSLIPTGPFSRS